MKISVKNRLTPRQLHRVKVMSGVTLTLLLWATLAEHYISPIVAQAQGEDTSTKFKVATKPVDTAEGALRSLQQHMGPDQGKYVYNQVRYNMMKRTSSAEGYIEEYTNKGIFCTSALYLPGLSLMHDGVLGIASLLVLLYLFLGIAIVADIFVEAIEVITSKKVMIQVPDPSNPAKMLEVTRDVWNPTVANLTLMALGSSMPEILLSCFSTVSDLDGVPSELGPAAIVGSAAFNLLVISAVSITAVTQVKYINDVAVFIWTCVASTFAYMWFYLVLAAGTSPNQVELWEAIVTIICFLILVIVAYLFDRRTNFQYRQKEASLTLKQNAAKYALRAVSQKIGTFPIIQMAQNVLPVGHTEKELRDIVENYKIAMGEEAYNQATFEELMDVIKENNNLERLVYRKAVAKQTTLSRKNFCKVEALHGQVEEAITQKLKNRSKTVHFRSLHYTVVEGTGKVILTVLRCKECEGEFKFRVKTEDGTAKDIHDYNAINKEFTMKASQNEQEICIDIKDDDKWEPDKDFHVYLCSTGMSQAQFQGEDTHCAVTVIDNDNPGIIGFTERNLIVRPRDEICSIIITREKGSSGEVSAEVCISNTGEALAGRAAQQGIDYIELAEPRITFKNGETKKVVHIKMPNTSVKEEMFKNDKTQDELTEEEREAKLTEIGNKSAFFQVELKNPVPEGLKLSRRHITFVEIRPQSQETDKVIDEQRAAMVKHFLQGDSASMSWGYQFKSATMLGPTIDDDGAIDEVTATEALMHFLQVPWKVIFATIPPRRYGGGWVAFVVALAEIGIVTFVVQEVALTLGCAIRLPVAVNAITIVALGTSLPDTFASKLAAEQSQYADNAVGNVTGSNAVNVFLGMGLPWIISATYQLYVNNTPAYVPAGNLEYSVLVFLCCSMVCFLVLLLRRCFVHGELGGPALTKYASALILVLLWVIYITLNTIKILGINDEMIEDPSKKVDGAAAAPATGSE